MSSSSSNLNPNKNTDSTKLYTTEHVHQTSGLPKEDPNRPFRTTKSASKGRRGDDRGVNASDNVGGDGLMVVGLSQMIKLAVMVVVLS